MEEMETGKRRYQSRRRLEKKVQADKATDAVSCIHFYHVKDERSIPE